MIQSLSYLRRVLSAACCAGMCAQPAVAGNESRYEAFRLSARTFEVVADFSESDIYWCGASLYAQTRLKARATQKIYVLRGPGPSVGKAGYVAVVFGLDAPAGPPVGPIYSLDVDIVGNAQSVAQAYGGCSARSASG